MTAAKGGASLLVLCDGNHCRSPLAEYLFRARLGPAARVASAGFRGLEGLPMHPEALELLAERGLDGSGFRGRLLRPPMLLEADLVLVMEAWQQEACEAMAPAAKGRVFLLGRWLEPPAEIEDPIALGPGALRETLGALEPAVETWVRRL